jgi:hypothetical protein
LAALQRDTSGSYNSQIVSLQQEIAQLMQSNADTDVDNELERLKKEQEERQKEREIQTQQLENLISFRDDNNTYWEMANEMLAEGYQVVSGFLAAREQNNDQSELATQEAIAQTNQQLADVYAQLGTYDPQQLQVSTDIKTMLNNFLTGDGNSVSGLLNKLGLLDVDITNSLTTTVNNISQTINQGFTTSLATIQSGFNTFWNQFDQLRNNISGNGTGIISALNSSSAQASRDAATISNIGRYIQSSSSSTASSTATSARNSGTISYNTGNTASAAWSASSSASRAASETDSIYSMVSTIRGTLWDVSYRAGAIMNKVQRGWTFYQGSISLFGLGASLGASYGKIYKTGGYANYTGPAWVDGTKTKPEAFLNAKQTELFEQLRDNLTSTNVSNTNGKEDSEDKGDTINIDTVAIQVKELADTDTVDKVVKQVKNSIYNDATSQNKMQVRRR